jgi:hypothetical protein
VQDAVILLVVFSVPLAAILGRTFIKYKTLELERGKADGGSETARRLAALEKANAELRERVETLETIAIDSDTRSAGVAGARALEAHEEAARKL